MKNNLKNRLLSTCFCIGALAGSMVNYSVANAEIIKPMFSREEIEIKEQFLDYTKPITDYKYLGEITVEEEFNPYNLDLKAKVEPTVNENINEANQALNEIKEKESIDLLAPINDEKILEKPTENLNDKLDVAEKSLSNEVQKIETASGNIVDGSEQKLVLPKKQIHKLTAEEMVGRINLHLVKGDIQKASSALESFEKNYPDDDRTANLYLNLGNKAVEKKDFTAATSFFAESYKKDKIGTSRGLAILNLGKTQLETGNKEAACSAFSQVASGTVQSNNSVKKQAEILYINNKCD